MMVRECLEAFWRNSMRAILLLAAFWGLLWSQEPLQEKLLFANYASIPETLYHGQILKVTLEAKVFTEAFSHLQIEFEDEQGITLLGDPKEWYEARDATLRREFYVHIGEGEVRFPTLKVALLDHDKEIIDQTTLPPIKAPIVPLISNVRFSGVLAKSMRIKTSKLEQYDADHNIFILEIEADEANLNTFSLPFVVQEGIDWIEDKQPLSKLFYYGKIEKGIRSVNFNYFNLDSGEFEKIDVPFDVKSMGQHVSTQIEINPNKRPFPYLQTVVFGSFGTLFLLLFIWRRNYLYLAGVLFIVAGAIYSFQDRTVTVRSGTTVYLLPTERSSHFYTTRVPMVTEHLMERRGYTKIMLPDDKIGWVRSENVY